MIRAVGVRLRQRARLQYFRAGSLALKVGGAVIVGTDAGKCFGRVADSPRLADEHRFQYPLRKVLRIATPDDHRLVARHMELERRALLVCHQKVAEQKLSMRLVASEFTFDGKKAIFYFTAEGRVDFRHLVKSLARQFRVRIEMRQIGVRDEARMLGGHGQCGRRLCCSVYLNEFEPVSIRMAKVQNLTLNPSKISGVCGRLMCCLVYEHGAYQQLRARMPKCGREVTCPEGPCKVVKADFLDEKVTLELEDGRRFQVPLDSLEVDEGCIKFRE